MLNNIKLNRFVNRKTFIHSLNALDKLLTLFMFAFISLITKSIYIHILLMCFLILLIGLCKISIKEYFKALKYFLYLLIGIFLINLLFNINIIENITSLLKIIELVIYTSIITMTTKENEIMYSIDTLLKPFDIFKKNKVGLIFSLTLKFIPVVIDQINSIIKNLLSKGINIKKNKMLVLKSIIVPSLKSSIKKADNLAESLEVRLYNAEEFKYNNIYNKWRLRDSIIITSFILITIIIGVIK